MTAIHVTRPLRVQRLNGLPLRQSSPGGHPSQASVVESDVSQFQGEKAYHLKRQQSSQTMPLSLQLHQWSLRLQAASLKYLMRQTTFLPPLVVLEFETESPTTAHWNLLHEAPNCHLNAHYKYSRFPPFLLQILLRQQHLLKLPISQSSVLPRLPWSRAQRRSRQMSRSNNRSAHFWKASLPAFA